MLLRWRYVTPPIFDWLRSLREKWPQAAITLATAPSALKAKRCRSVSGCYAAHHNPRLTDPFTSLQAGKTVDISRCASEINRLASAFRTASVASPLRLTLPTRPAAGRLAAAAAHRAAVVVLRIRRGDSSKVASRHQRQRQKVRGCPTAIRIPLL